MLESKRYQTADRKKPGEGRKMQKVIYMQQIQEYCEYIDQSVIDYINDGQIETFESFDTYDFIAFDWYDLKNLSAPPAQIIIYLDADDIFYICENGTSYEVAKRLFSHGETNEQALYLFFCNLFKGSTAHLEALENKIAELDDDVSSRIRDGQKEKITSMRYEILKLRRYYDQLETIFEYICDNDNELVSERSLRYFEILKSRSVKLVSQLTSLREYIMQVRESYQAQIGIEQNELMKVFTMVTSIFLPLTLIAGWYGMNVQMPEFGWKYGYPFVAGLSAVVCIVWLIVFKKKKWL